MEKVLVTGAGGFIGSHLVEALVEQGARVKALVHYNSAGSWGWLDTFSQELKSKIEVVAGDIRDPAYVGEIVKDTGTVFHLAALIAIPFSYHSPHSYIETNITGTLNILQACRNNNVGRLLVTSTSEVYGTAQYVPIDENHPRQGQSPYSASKIGADSIAESFYRSFNLPLTIVRPFNAYGPRQSARAVIPAIISQLLAGEKKLKLGSLDPTRDFNYVKDTVAGFIKIAQSEKCIGKDLNIATGKEVSIGELARELIEQIDPEAELVCDQQRLRPEKSEVNRLLGDNKKIKDLTAWQPGYSLQQGLVETVAWIRKNLHYYKTDRYNI